MKKVHLIGLAIILGIAALAFVAALNMGEKSPILAAGTIELDPALAAKAEGIETLFIVIHDADSPMPMPYGAVKERLSPSESPKGGAFYNFYITKEKIQGMGMERPAPQRMRIKARLDRDGMGGMDQPGDLTGQVSDVPLGADNVVVKIDTVVP